MKPPLHVREINRARDYYNPLRGLDVPRVVQLLEEGERGRYAELQKLNRITEKRHPTLRALKQRRLGALKKLDWDVKLPGTLPAGITAAQAATQQVLLRSRYELIENLPQAFEFLAMPTFRGFSHLEPNYQENDPSLPVVRLQPVPQWHWLRDPQDFGVWRYDPEARSNVSSSVPIDPADFIIREIEDPLCEITLLCYLRRNLAKKNWTVFQEDYALASIFAMLGENTPHDKVAEWLELVKKVTNNSRGALPPGSEIKAFELGNLDGVQFENFIKAEDSDLVLAGTSGLLTMLTAPTGMDGGSQGKAHEQTFSDLAVAEAAEISAIFQAQFDKPILAREFPSQPAVAYFELAAKDEEDVTALADRAVKFSQAGLQVDAREMSEKSGLTLTIKAAPAPVPPPVDAPPSGDTALKNRATAVTAGREARFLAKSQANLAAADQVALKPAIERVAALDAITDDAEFAKAYGQFLADLPALEALCLGDQATAALETAFEEIIGTALVSGAVTAAEAKANSARSAYLATTPQKTGQNPA